MSLRAWYNLAATAAVKLNLVIADGLLMSDMCMSVLSCIPVLSAVVVWAWYSVARIDLV